MHQLRIVVPFCLSLLEVVHVDTCISSRPMTTTTTTWPTTTTTALSMVYIRQAIRDDTRILKHSNVSICMYACVVSNLNHTTCAATQPSVSSCTGNKSWAVQCRDGTCINMANICDGTIDCATGEDEAECREIFEYNYGKVCLLKEEQYSNFQKATLSLRS